MKQMINEKLQQFYDKVLKKNNEKKVGKKNKQPS